MGGGECSLAIERNGCTTVCAKRSNKQTTILSDDRRRITNHNFYERRREKNIEKTDICSTTIEEQECVDYIGKPNR